MTWICTKCHRIVENKLECCGSTEVFDPAQHGSTLVSLSNAWLAVWKHWQDHPLLEQVSAELAEDGIVSAPVILDKFIGRLANGDN